MSFSNERKILCPSLKNKWPDISLGPCIHDSGSNLQSPGHSTVSICIWVLIEIYDSILAQVVHVFFFPNQVFSVLLSPHALSPSSCCCPNNGMVEREKMLIAQRLSGHIWYLANKACTEWWCVWQSYCAKNHLV